MGWHQTIIIGNVGKDPDMRYTPTNIPVCSFSTAVTERWNDRQTNEKKEKTTWYRVTAWRGLAETCAKYIKKGMPIMVIGTVEVRAYTNNAGEAAASLELTAHEIKFLDTRGGQHSNPEEAENANNVNYDDFAPPTNMGDIQF